MAASESSEDKGQLRAEHSMQRRLGTSVSAQDGLARGFQSQEASLGDGLLDREGLPTRGKPLLLASGEARKDNRNKNEVESTLGLSLDVQTDGGT